MDVKLKNFENNLDNISKENHILKISNDKYLGEIDLINIKIMIIIIIEEIMFHIELENSMIIKIIIIKIILKNLKKKKKGGC